MMNALKVLFFNKNHLFYQKLNQIFILDDLNDVLIQIRQLIRPQSATVEQFKFNDIYSFKTPKINNLCKYLKETKSRTQSSKVRDFQ